MPMPMNGYYYLPLTPGYFAILVVIYVIVGVLLISTLRYAYESLGVGSGTALLLLFGSLVGSYFNIPVAQLPPEHLMSEQVRDFFGMLYVVPRVQSYPGTTIAVNVGGAVIPTLMSLYLLVSRRLWVRGLIARHRCARAALDRSAGAWRRHRSSDLRAGRRDGRR